LDDALVGEHDSVSTSSSTLSGTTAPITSKRSFDAVDESEHTAEQSSLSQSIVPELLASTNEAIRRPEKDANAMTRLSTASV
jgi:hypothetical protein